MSQPPPQQYGRPPPPSAYGYPAQPTYPQPQDHQRFYPPQAPQQDLHYPPQGSAPPQSGPAPFYVLPHDGRTASTKPMSPPPTTAGGPAYPTNPAPYAPYSVPLQQQQQPHRQASGGPGAYPQELAATSTFEQQQQPQQQQQQLAEVPSYPPPQQHLQGQTQHLPPYGGGYEPQDTGAYGQAQHQPHPTVESHGTGGSHHGYPGGGAGAPPTRHDEVDVSDYYR